MLSAVAIALAVGDDNDVVALIVAYLVQILL